MGGAGPGVTGTYGPSATGAGPITEVGPIVHSLSHKRWCKFALILKWYGAGAGAIGTLSLAHSAQRFSPFGKSLERPPGVTSRFPGPLRLEPIQLGETAGLPGHGSCPG